MLITKLIIDNFRIYRHKEFEFGNNKFILLSGANGFGKTTMIDAIEWCLTGDISRIKSSYAGRYTTNAEKNRAENKKGIIKNHNSRAEDKIKVSLTLDVEGNKVVIYREQKEDSLFIDTKMEFEGDVSDSLKNEIYKLANNKMFYNYHVCDTNKAYCR